MRLSLCLLALTALSTGGCVFPCSNGACSSTGEPRYVTPAARFFGKETLLKKTKLNCDLGRCQPSPYLTCSKYLPFMDKWTSSAMAKRCADRYLLRQQLQTRRWISQHYKAGFRDAFQDIANGESGEVPPVPPPKYWNTHYRTKNGKQCVELYFDGYRSGSALAASEMTTMKTIGASYDWSIQESKSPYEHAGACSTWQGCSASGGCPPTGPGQTMQFASGFPQEMPTQFGQPSPGCQAGGIPAEQPFVFSVSPQTNPLPPASDIGPANSYPTPNNYGTAPIPDPGFGYQQNQMQHYPRQFPGSHPGVKQQPSPGFTNPIPNLPSPAAKELDSRSNLNLSAPALPTPGYADSGGNFSPEASPQTQNSQPNNDQTRSGSPQSRPLTPGFSGPPLGQIKPGKLGPPDKFKTDPPVWQYRSPQR